MIIFNKTPKYKKKTKNQNPKTLNTRTDCSSFEINVTTPSSNRKVLSEFKTICEWKQIFVF